MNKITLLEEFRLIERSENEVNIAWKGAHLLLFFLAFVFGSFCTFCFHMLMYLFDEKCVLFPKLLSLSSLRHNVIYEFIPEDKEKSETLPVDFLSTQWVEKSACYLPTYVPLVSGIFGLVWTTMFLMCSTGSRTLTGLQRPWRVVPPVFVFSLAMSGLCIYSSTMTHRGLQELCIKLGEITGSKTCSYTVNVATLAYERRIRGVYQATRLTIFSAWLHTSCWLLSALLALVRVLLAVDFKLVRVSVDLLGDLDKMLQNHEEHIRTVSPSNLVKYRSTSELSLSSSRTNIFEDANDISLLLSAQSDILYFADEHPPHISEMSLVPEERFKLARLEAFTSVPKENQFIVKILYDMVDDMVLPESRIESSPSIPSISSLSLTKASARDAIFRQYGQEAISSKSPVLNEPSQFQPFDSQEAEIIAKEIKRNLQERLNRQLIELPINADTTSPSSSKKRGHIAFESSLNITSEMKRTLEEKLTRGLRDAEQEAFQQMEVKKKSNLKNIGVQTDKQKEDSKNKHKVTISEPKSSYSDSSSESSGSKDMDDKDTQTHHKEKQD